jgi:hypothetical protein
MTLSKIKELQDLVHGTPINQMKEKFQSEDSKKLLSEALRDLYSVFLSFESFYAESFLSYRAGYKELKDFLDRGLPLLIGEELASKEEFFEE